MEENFEWFLENYDAIFRLCGECNIVIFEKKIVGVFSSYAEACKWAEEKDLLGRCNVQHCDGTENGYTVYIN